jgi:hypothetical protein
MAGPTAKGGLQATAEREGTAYTVGNHDGLILGTKANGLRLG